MHRKLPSWLSSPIGETRAKIGHLSSPIFSVVKPLIVTLDRYTGDTHASITLANAPFPTPGLPTPHTPPQVAYKHSPVTNDHHLIGRQLPQNIFHYLQHTLWDDRVLSRMGVVDFTNSMVAWRIDGKGLVKK